MNFALAEGHKVKSVRYEVEAMFCHQNAQDFLPLFFLKVYQHEQGHHKEGEGYDLEDGPHPKVDTPMEKHPDEHAPAKRGLCIRLTTIVGSVLVLFLLFFGAEAWI